MNKYTLHHGNNKDVLKEIADCSIDSVVTDPPYEIGFMGRNWDASGIANNPDMWREVLRVLKPGGHLLAFGATRTYHRMTTAIEDAGFEIRDSIHWIYGTGFPKSHDIAKGIDKRGGNGHLTEQVAAMLKQCRIAHDLTVREADKLFCGGTSNWSWYEGRPRGTRAPTNDMIEKIIAVWPETKDLLDQMLAAEREVVGQGKSGVAGAFGEENWASIEGLVRDDVYDITANATDSAKTWDGWGSALKPAHEPIVIARKPLVGTTLAENVLLYGTGGLNIAAARIESGDEYHTQCNRQTGDHFSVASGKNVRDTIFAPSSGGRFPTNVIFDTDAADLLDKQTGTLKSGTLLPTHKRDESKRDVYGSYNGYEPTQTFMANEGGGSRFFKIVQHDPESASPFYYCAKPSKSEKNAGLGEFDDVRGSTEQFDSRWKDGDGDERKPVTKNAHPTVKPVQLMRYLCKLVTPPGGTVLDPFCGSGTTGIAAILEGFRPVLIELTDEYIPLIKARLQHAVDNPEAFVHTRDFEIPSEEQVVVRSNPFFSFD